jgi:carbon monoxide dehydrogenase subunit G
MQLKGSYTFQSPRAAVWEALMDPTVLAQALPGGEQLEKVGENEYKAAMNVRVGPVQGKFEGSVELSAIQELIGYRMKVGGSGPSGFVNGEGAITLADDGAGTQMSYDGDVQVGGRIAGVGQRLIDSTARSIVKQGLKVLDEQIQTRLAPPSPPPIATAVPHAVAGTPQTAPIPRGAPPTMAPIESSSRPQPVAAPSTAKLAADVATDVIRDLATDYVPLNQQEKLFYAVTGALGMLLFVILVRLVQRRD